MGKPVSYPQFIVRPEGISDQQWERINGRPQKPPSVRVGGGGTWSTILFAVVMVLICAAIILSIIERNGLWKVVSDGHI